MFFINQSKETGILDSFHTVYDEFEFYRYTFIQRNFHTRKHNVINSRKKLITSTCNFYEFYDTVVCSVYAEIKCDIFKKSLFVFKAGVFNKSILVIKRIGRLCVVFLAAITSQLQRKR